MLLGAAGCGKKESPAESGSDSEKKKPVSTTDRGAAVDDGSAADESGDEREIRETRYESGELKSRISYLDGVKDGEAIEYYKNGKVRLRYTFVQGKVNGIVKSYHESGILEEEGQYKDGQPHGLERQFDENGVLRYEQTYRNGKLHGTEKKYRDGKLSWKKEYANGKQHGAYTVYYQDSDKLWWIDTYADGRLHGPSKHFHRNGKTSEEGAYVDNNKDGIWKEYESDGKLRRTISYKKGKILSLKEYGDGYLSGRDFYENGKRVRSESYDKDGTLSSKNLYDVVNGTNKWVIYSSDGSYIRQVRVFGKKHIEKWARYNEDGTCESLALYKDGKKVKEIKNPSAELLKGILPKE